MNQTGYGPSYLYILISFTNTLYTVSGDDDTDEDEFMDDDGDADWDEEDDPDKLWCVCRQPYNNRSEQAA